MVDPDLTVSEPAVSVFPADRVGRPLGMVSDRGSTLVVPPGGSWSFETQPIDGSVSAWVAFSEAALSR
jgi:hypothetical protein